MRKKYEEEEKLQVLILSKFRNNKNSNKKKWSSMPTLIVNFRKRQPPLNKKKDKSLMAKIKKMPIPLEVTSFMPE